MESVRPGRAGSRFNRETAGPLGTLAALSTTLNPENRTFCCICSGQLWSRTSLYFLNIFHTILALSVHSEDL